MIFVETESGRLMGHDSNSWDVRLVLVLFLGSFVFFYGLRIQKFHLSLL